MHENAESAGLAGLARRIWRAGVSVAASAGGMSVDQGHGKVREYLFTFLEHPDVTADNNGSERKLRPTATYRKVNCIRW